MILLPGDGKNMIDLRIVVEFCSVLFEIDSKDNSFDLGNQEWNVSVLTEIFYFSLLSWSNGFRRSAKLGRRNFSEVASDYVSTSFT